MKYEVLKNLKFFIKKLLPLNIYILFFKKKRERVIKKIRKYNKIEELKIDDLKKLKKTDTLFILGSGESINLITDEEWKIIEKNDSVGFNFWLYHEFVPTLYVYEESIDDEERNKIFYEMLNLKKEKYIKNKFIVKSLREKFLIEKIPNELKKNFLLSNEIEGLCYDKNILKKFLALIKEKNELIQIRGTIIYLLGLAYILGYKKIVLCGIDLNSTSYFYDDIMYNKYTIPKNEMKNIHFIERKLKDKLPVSEIIIEMEKFLFQGDKKLYIAKNIGALKNKIDVYNFKKSELNEKNIF